MKTKIEKLNAVYLHCEEYHTNYYNINSLIDTNFAS
jgi:hypothetical protein